MITASEAREASKRVELENRILESEKELEEFDKYLPIFDNWVKRAVGRGQTYIRIAYLPDSVMQLASKNGYIFESSQEDRKTYGQFTTIVKW